MQKTFTILSITYQQTNPEYGSATWVLHDEAGQQRRVVALTILSRNGAVNEIHPVHLREVPLVEALQGHQVNDRFSIDFSQFNAEYHYSARESLSGV